MLRRLLVGLPLMLAACSGSAPVVAAPSPTGSPSEATLLICGDEASEEIADQLGVQRTDALNPVWQPPLYSCKYNYAESATMVLSVRQLDDEAAAAKFLTGTATTVADDPGAVAPDGSVSVRKNGAVLTVDVSGLPAQFGQPAKPRATVALNVATIIATAWNEQ